MDNPLHAYHEWVEGALHDLNERLIPLRIAHHDHTVWKPEPTEIANRLGWLDSAARLLDEVEAIQTLAADLRAEGYQAALLLGMGGSSLAPELFSLIFGAAGDGLELQVLDSTAPEAVLAQRARLNLAHTLFIVSSKSGGTVEMISFFKYFYTEVAAALGTEAAGRHFITITDPGSGLAQLAERYHFRATFLNDPNIGGRYSALSHFGLVPAALVGVDITRYLENAVEMMRLCDLRRQPAEANPAAVLAAIMAAAAAQGRDKVTLVLPPALLPFGAWVEQLVAESVGKEGKGVLPVVGESLGDPAVYGADRLFVAYQAPAGDEQAQTALTALEAAGHPVVRLDLRDAYDLAGEMFRWELATAFLGYFLEINPFDQPNVEAAKVLARQAVQQYQTTGALPQPTPTFHDGTITGFGADGAHSTVAALADFLDQAQAGDYVALQAYLPPTPATTAQLTALQHAIRRRTRLATTLGYGPRFLHSTGQLHKGDAGRGLFLVLTHDPAQDVPIPDEAGAPAASLSFGVLLRAQALGDMQALEAAGRRVLRLHLGADIAAGLQLLHEVLA